MAFKNDFRPDIVAGNPPYNNGMDIDFVFDAFEVAKVAVAEITPAKFQTAEADQKIDSTHSYGEFREKLVPHIKNIVYFPQSMNVFNIYQIDGITFYTLVKNNIYDKAIVENRCLEQELYNSKELRSITNRESLYNIGNKVVEALGNIEHFTFSYPTDKRFQVWTNTQVSGSGSKFMTTKGKATVLGVSRVIDTYNNEKPVATASKCIFSSDNINECNSFISWLNTKLVRFLVGINTSKLTGILTNDTFRFVPMIDKFDHLYSNNELIQKYGLNEYVHIIEGVISDKDE